MNDCYESQEDFLEDNGLNLQCVYNGASNKEYGYIDNRGICAIINFDKNEFTLSWMIPHTTFSMEAHKSSPFTNHEHFLKMYNRFSKCVDQYLDNSKRV